MAARIINSSECFTFSAVALFVLATSLSSIRGCAMQLVLVLVLLQPQTNVSGSHLWPWPRSYTLPSGGTTIPANLSLSLILQCILNDPVGVHRDETPASLSSSFTTVPHCVAKVKPRLNWPELTQARSQPARPVSKHGRRVDGCELGAESVTGSNRSDAQWCIASAKMRDLSVAKRWKERGGKSALKNS